MRQEDIDNWFQYHAPTVARITRYNDLRSAAKAFAEMFDKSVPDCADKTAAMRHLRETMMAMNLAIACNPEIELKVTEIKLASVTEEKPESHGVESTYFDNIGFGWRMDCTCGFQTGLNLNLAETGEEMDTHFNEYTERLREQ